MCRLYLLDIECHMTEAAGVVVTAWVVTLVKSCAERTFHTIACVVRFHGRCSYGSKDWHNPMVLTACSGDFTGLFSLLEWQTQGSSSNWNVRLSSNPRFQVFNWLSTGPSWF